MKITRIGIDLAKQVFQIHGVDRDERAVLKRQLRRQQMQPFFAKLEPCLIGMEACASAHYWARELMKQGHLVKLMAPQHVKPYVKGNKNDATNRRSRAHPAKANQCSQHNDNARPCGVELRCSVKFSETNFCEESTWIPEICITTFPRNCLWK